MLAKAADKIRYIPDVLYYYRTNEGSITNSFNAKEIDEFIISRRFLWAELEQLGLDNDTNKKVLYAGYLRRVSDWAYQASVSSMKTEEKISHLNNVCESDMFSQAMKNTDLSQFGKAKQVRLKLLPHLHSVSLSLGFSSYIHFISILPSCHPERSEGSDYIYFMHSDPSRCSG